jgi:hypothetical protein
MMVMVVMMFCIFTFCHNLLENIIEQRCE